MSERDLVEYYNGARLLVAINSSIVPPVGSLISIAKTTWEVASVSYAIDQSVSTTERRTRANVDLVKP